MKVRFLILCLFIFSISLGYGQDKAYYNQTEFGAMFGRVENQWSGEIEERINFSMLTFHGARVSKYHVVGFSLGFDHYENLSIVPIAFGWRGFFGKEGKAQLIGGFDIGGGSTILEKGEESEWGKSWYEGGIMASPSVGAYFPDLNGKTALTLTLAFKSQELSYFSGSYNRQGTMPFPSSQLPPGFNSLTETDYLFQSLVLRLGLSF
ncbi:MAG TPA: hypothetical protein VLA71_10780 [Algoriphagus sp.]|nr:hypothetical protein [Algoriphagus sp.]